MTSYDNLCMNCMCDTNGKTECPNCGFSSTEPQMCHALPYKTLLQNRYIVGRAVKSNGEGITYIGYDTVLNMKIKLCEFFPQTLCGRSDSGNDICVIGGSEIIFDECLSAFLSYSRNVAHMRELSSIVQIYDIFEENHTAYTISESNESITLRYFVERSGGSLSWNVTRQLFMPVLSALSAMHAADICHLGISPDTLIIMKDGKMKLGSFCINTVRRLDTDLSPDLVAGCAAIEQYVMNYVSNEATDVYGFSASLFFALTGNLPQDALKRRTNMRLLIPTSILRSIPSHVVTALANALQVSPDRRTPTFERLRAELSASPTVTATIEDTQIINKIEEESEVKKGVPNYVWAILTCVIALIIFTVVGIIWISNTAQNNNAAIGTDALQTESSVVGEIESQFSSDELDNSDTILAPDFIGQDFEKLTKANVSSENKDYQVFLSSKKFSDTVPEGCVISQSPEPNSKITKGTAIVVVVSKGESVHTLPSIEGKTLAEALQVVTSDGFIPTKIEEFSSTVEQGRVIGYKDVKAGSRLNYGTKVVIVISKGSSKSTS